VVPQLPLIPNTSQCCNPELVKSGVIHSKVPSISNYALDVLDDLTTFLDFLHVGSTSKLQTLPKGLPHVKHCSPMPPFPSCETQNLPRDCIDGALVSDCGAAIGLTTKWTSSLSLGDMAHFVTTKPAENDIYLDALHDDVSAFEFGRYSMEVVMEDPYDLSAVSYKVCLVQAKWRSTHELSLHKGDRELTSVHRGKVVLYSSTFIDYVHSKGFDAVAFVARPENALMESRLLSAFWFKHIKHVPDSVSPLDATEQDAVFHDLYGTLPKSQLLQNSRVGGPNGFAIDNSGIPTSAALANLYMHGKTPMMSRSIFWHFGKLTVRPIYISPYETDRSVVCYGSYAPVQPQGTIRTMKLDNKWSGKTKSCLESFFFVKALTAPLLDALNTAIYCDSNGIEFSIKVTTAAVLNQKLTNAVARLHASAFDGQRKFDAFIRVLRDTCSLELIGYKTGNHQDIGCDHALKFDNKLQLLYKGLAVSKYKKRWKSRRMLDLFIQDLIQELKKLKFEFIENKRALLSLHPVPFYGPYGRGSECSGRCIGALIDHGKWTIADVMEWLGDHGPVQQFVLQEAGVDVEDAEAVQAFANPDPELVQALIDWRPGTQRYNHLPGPVNYNSDDDSSEN